LQPQRTSGGFRLYSKHDETRIRSMQGHLAAGLSAAEAARASLVETKEFTPTQMDSPQANRLAALRAHLAERLGELDEPSAQTTLDSLLAEFTVETVLKDVLIPYLHDLGQHWEHGRVSVAHEHFASNVVRGRLAGLARAWGGGHGPHVLLACAPGELHDIGLMAFGIVLQRLGWRVGYLGADTPVDTLLETADRLGPDLVVLSATAPELFTAAASDLSPLARSRALAIGGAGASDWVAETTGARMLAGDPVSAARALRI
jgi:methanogenic corrinoid protein MtbC1